MPATTSIVQRTAPWTSTKRRGSKSARRLLNAAACVGLDRLLDAAALALDEHYDECPEHVKAACYGELIKPSSNWRLKYVNLLRMMADDDQYYGCEEDEIGKKIDKMTKKEIINAIIPEAFAAGVIYDFIRRTTEEYKGAEDPEGDD